MSAKTCAHPACSCSVRAEELYCSPVCDRRSRREGSRPEGCDCRHVTCLGSAGEGGSEELARGAELAPGE